MHKKIFLTLSIISTFLIFFCSSSFANNDAMNNARNAAMNTGNAIGNAVTGTANALVNGTKKIGNGIANVGNDAVNGAKDLGNDAVNTMDTTTGMLSNADGNYTLTRTSTTNNNFLGMSDSTWTWLILGIVGLAIVGLVWYYGAQYEHRNYNND